MVFLKFGCVYNYVRCNKNILWREMLKAKIKTKY